MAEFYKLEIAKWNEGTDDLTLEQEAAYLRVINAIRLTGQPIANNLFVLGGLWRCNDRKAKRLLAELVAAGKVQIEGARIVNRKAVDDASNLDRLRAERASAGRRGGVESGKSRAKSLEKNKPPEASASTREDKIRIDKSSVTNVTGDLPKNDPAKVLFDTGIRLLGAAGIPERKARPILGRWRKAHGDPAVIDAVGRAGREAASDPVAFIEGYFRFQKKKAAPQPGDRRELPDGRVQEFQGGVDGWMEVIQ